MVEITGSFSGYLSIVVRLTDVSFKDASFIFLFVLLYWCPSIATYAEMLCWAHASWLVLQVVCCVIYVSYIECLLIRALHGSLDMDKYLLKCLLKHPQRYLSCCLLHLYLTWDHDCFFIVSNFPNLPTQRNAVLIHLLPVNTPLLWHFKTWIRCSQVNPTNCFDVTHLIQHE